MKLLKSNNNNNNMTEKKINQTIIITQKKYEIKFVNEKKIRKNLG